jgi:hypothetical protein
METGSLSTSPTIKMHFQKQPSPLIPLFVLFPCPCSNRILEHRYFIRISLPALCTAKMSIEALSTSHVNGLLKDGFMASFPVNQKAAQTLQ